MTNFYPALSTLPTSKLVVPCYVFLQERIQKSSPCVILGGRAPKRCVQSLKRKIEEESNKLKKIIMIFDV